MWVLRMYEPYDIRYVFERLSDVYDFYMGVGSDGQRESLAEFKFSGNFKGLLEAATKEIASRTDAPPSLEPAPRHYLEYFEPWMACKNPAENWDPENTEH